MLPSYVGIITKKKHSKDPYETSIEQPGFNGKVRDPRVGCGDWSIDHRHGLLSKEKVSQQWWLQLCGDILV